jgi:hypothetical protein
MAVCERTILALISPPRCQSGFMVLHGHRFATRNENKAEIIVTILMITTGNVAGLSDDELRLQGGEVLERSVASGSDETQWRRWYVYLEKSIN